jgi:hypothetical protein
MEHGKPIEDVRRDALRSLYVAETACSLISQTIREVLDVSKDMEAKAYKKPLGVTAVICHFSECSYPSSSISFQLYGEYVSEAWLEGV